MGRSKTREYRVVVNIQNIICNDTTVSKEVYDRELVALKRLVSQVKNRDIAEGQIEVVDRDGVIETTYKVTFPATTIKVTSIVCKPGYTLVDRYEQLLLERKDSRNEKN